VSLVLEPSAGLVLEPSADLMRELLARSDLDAYRGGADV